MNRVFPLVLAAGVTLLSTASALLLLGYLSQVRQPMGVVRDALIIDMARSQEDVARIASLKQLAGFDNTPRAHEFTQVADTLHHRLRLLSGTATRLPATQRDAVVGYLERAEHSISLLAHPAFSDTTADTDDTLRGLASTIDELTSYLMETESHQRKLDRRLALVATILTALVLMVGVVLFVALLRLERHSNALHYLAMTDDLTQLYNRRQWLDQAPHLLALRRPADSPVALMLLDLDHFKRINDDFGHPAGDKVLKAFGVMLKRVARRSDLAARLGGDEFALLMPQADARNAETVGERIRHETEHFDPTQPAAGANLTVSIGIAVSSHADDDFSTLYRRADQALYQAKHQGRNCIRLG
ncbi:GGDEF domain-containing protein [Halomonas litopenaei]|uniref:GGDEF domain-containing protein n=1 Tax=Halomonas litopenaei TaxID=2109328 RepID=UPI003FA0A049